MQNKGFVIFITSMLAVICLYYLSFTPVVNHYEKKAAELTARGGDGKAYLDSMANENVWMGHTLKKARMQQIGLGLDLKGGMNVVLRLDGSDLLRNLSGHNPDPQFNKAVDISSKTASASAGFIDRFVTEYKKLNPQGQLALLFSNGPMKEQIQARMSDEDVVRVIKEKYNSAVDASINVLRTRIDRFGVVSPNIQRIEGQDRILVELPGVKEPERVRDLLQKSANLQFWRTYSYEEVIGDLEVADQRLSMVAEAQAPQAETDSLASNDSTLIASTTEAQKVKEGSLFSLLSPVNRGPIVGVAKAAHRDRIDAMIERAHEQRLIREDLMLLWSNSPIKDPQTRKETDMYELYAVRGLRSAMPDLSGDVVTNAKSEVRNDIGQNKPVVSMSMNEEGARKWSRLTKENINRSIAIVLDGVVYSAPNVGSEITGGNSEISGNFTIEETTDLANVLNSGKMEASVIIEQENVVGPTLGQASIRAGLISFFVALILLAIYMCMAYGIVPGLIADGALVINAFFTLGIMSSFGAVLTLSGIAGLVLTLGMAVDANVLIFERIKEELRAGKSISRAIQDGYGNAFSAIFDSNLTTIITGLVLYFFGTGPIKGFATTLIIGVICSFITAVFLTRIVVEFLDKKGKMNKVTYTTAMTRNLLVNPQFNILGRAKIGIAIPLVLIALGIAGGLTIGLNKGIEFSGGRNFIVRFDQPVNTMEVRKALETTFDNKVLVTTLGSEGTEIRVSTNYKIDESDETVETEVRTKLFSTLQSFYANPIESQDFDNDSDIGIISSQKVSASMSKDISQKALIAVLLSMLFMALYILIRFRNVSYSAGAFASVFATVGMIMALYVLLWKVMPFTMEIDQNFIAALLAIIGYSINDVVVVFDRIRETRKLYPNRDRYQTINDALNSTLTRTLNTSFTTFLVMFVIFILGGSSMRSFTFAILLGVVLGTYATLFVATPVAYFTANKLDKKKNK